MTANFGSYSLYIAQRSRPPFKAKVHGLAISNQPLQPGHHVSFVSAKKYKDAEGKEPCLPGDEVRLFICEDGMTFRCSGGVKLLPDGGLSMGPDSVAYDIRG